jgi:murein DD-endopeptidase MepM/ murein hydrolase activator NlpD
MWKSVKRKPGCSLTLLFALIVLLLAACGRQTPAPTNTPFRTDTPMPSETGTAMATASPVPSTPTLSPTAIIPSKTPGPVVCSPLEGFEIPDLADLITNPFAPPRSGSDDPHQGVDLSDIDPLYQIALEGRRVQAVMDGVVAGAIADRFPYGNALIVETRLALLPTELVGGLQLPTPAPTRQGHPSLTCPESENPAVWDETQRSLYLIYAHLKEPPLFQAGEAILCGQELNAIGSSGNSLNPHLHLELRVGPSGARFDSMAHYTASASLQEMYNYCLWRVSETFQLMDPMQLFTTNLK